MQYEPAAVSSPLSLRFGSSQSQIINAPAIAMAAGGMNKDFRP
jgi:hypothetical protein